MKLLIVFVLTKLKSFPVTVQHQRILSIISTITYFFKDSKAYLNAAILATFLMTAMKNVHYGTMTITCRVSNNKMTILSSSQLEPCFKFVKKKNKKIGDVKKPHMIGFICLELMEANLRRTDKFCGCYSQLAIAPLTPMLK